jgi:diacylglycerol kinase
MFFRKFIYALRGIGKAIREEKSFRVMLVCFVLLVTASALLRVTLLEWAVLLLCCGAVLAAELLNTAIERAVDIAAPEKHPLAEKAKDIAAGAVLVISIFTVIIGLIIFLPRIIGLISGSIIFF